MVIGESYVGRANGCAAFRRILHPHREFERDQCRSGPICFPITATVLFDGGPPEGLHNIREIGMKKITSEMISRRGAFSLLGLGAALGLAVPTTVLTMSEAEAQTVGMERREERRAGRQERRQDRRTARQDRREDRRNLYMQQK
jgi:hypothetical protein